MRSYLEALPAELIGAIVSLLSPQSKSALSRCNKRLNEICTPFLYHEASFRPSFTLIPLDFDHTSSGDESNDSSGLNKPARDKYQCHMKPCPPTAKHAQHLRHFKVVAVFDRTKKQSEPDKKELLISKQVLECLKAIAPGRLRTFEWHFTSRTSPPWLGEFLTAQSSLTTLSVSLSTKEEPQTIKFAPPTLPNLRKLEIRGLASATGILVARSIIQSAKGLTHLSLYPGLHQFAPNPLAEFKQQYPYSTAARALNVDDSLFDKSYAAGAVITQCILSLLPSRTKLQSLDVRDISLSHALARCLLNPNLEELGLIKCHNIDYILADLGQESISLKRLSLQILSQEVDHYIQLFEHIQPGLVELTVLIQYNRRFIKVIDNYEYDDTDDTLDVGDHQYQIQTYGGSIYEGDGRRAYRFPAHLIHRHTKTLRYLALHDSKPRLVLPGFDTKYIDALEELLRPLSLKEYSFCQQILSYVYSTSLSDEFDQSEVDLEQNPSVCMNYLDRSQLEVIYLTPPTRQQPDSGDSSSQATRWLQNIYGTNKDRPKLKYLALGWRGSWNIVFRVQWLKDERRASKTRWNPVVYGMKIAENYNILESRFRLFDVTFMEQEVLEALPAFRRSLAQEPY